MIDDSKPILRSKLAADFLQAWSQASDLHKTLCPSVSFVLCVVCVVVSMLIIRRIIEKSLVELVALHRNERGSEPIEAMGSSSRISRLRCNVGELNQAPFDDSS